MSLTATSTYDRIPYEGSALFQTHPDHLAALARLFEVSPPTVENCCVLEIGCAHGDNMIPMAVSLPRARFVGIDLSRRQIEVGQATIAALGLTNVELLEQSIMDLDVDVKQFDFIIAHGVYSWVPEEVQNGMLKLCAERLTPDGLAYISYNTYPGWHMGAMVREMMLYHMRNVTDTGVQVRSSRDFLATLVRKLAKYDNAYARCLREEAALIQPRPDFYLYHEYLGESNQPVYFHQFVERVAAHHLQYLAEARFGNMAVAQSPDLLRGFEDPGLDWIAREQYHDFLRGQSFRQSVLCRANISCSRTPSRGAMMSLRFTGNVRPSTPGDEHDSRKDVTGDFQFFSGKPILSVLDPLARTLLKVLWKAWPTSLSFATLQRRIESTLTSPESAPDGHASVMPADLADSLILCLAKDLINLHIADPAFTTVIGELPRASPVARRQAVAGQRVANFRHQMIDLLDFDRLVLTYLDGSHDRRALLAELITAVETGVFTIQNHGEPVADIQIAERLLAGELDDSLKRLAAGALLF